MTKTDKVLIGRKAICDYLDISEYIFAKLVEFGLPVRDIDNRWYAHVDNLDLFFQRFTNVRNRGIPDGVE